MQQDLNNILQQQLRGPHMPEAIGWWPLAPGWWILGLLCCVLVATAGWLLIRHIRANQYRRDALSELQAIYQQWLEDQNNSGFVQSANALLKRSMVAAGGNTSPVSMTGQAWCTELGRWSNTAFSSQTLSVLANAGYQSRPEINGKQLNEELVNWFKIHKQPPTCGHQLSSEPNQEPDHA